MREALLGKLVLVLSRATPEELAAVYRFATGEALPDTGPGGAVSQGEGSCRAAARKGLRSISTPAEVPLWEGVKTVPAYVFQWTGRDWKVVFGGGKPFYLDDLLAARCSDYLLHHPNDLIACFDLEVEIQPEKGAARARNSIQADSDARALRQYRQELPRVQAEKERAQAAGEQEKVARLEEDIQAFESALRGGGPADTGQRAYDNVRKAFGVLKEHLGQGGPEERAFAKHLSTHLSLGLDCLYRQPDGRIWA